MGNAIKLTVAALVLAVVGACIDLNKSEPIPTYVQHAFAETCRLSRYTCEGIDPPNVLYIPMYGVYGLYLGSRTVFIDTAVKAYEEGNTFAIGVLIHEIVHYLQTVEDGQTAIVTSPAEWCATEGEAYRVANWWLAEQNRLDLMIDWEKHGDCYPADRLPGEAVITINEDF